MLQDARYCWVEQTENCKEKISQKQDRMQLVPRYGMLNALDQTEDLAHKTALSERAQPLATPVSSLEAALPAFLQAHRV